MLLTLFISYYHSLSLSLSHTQILSHLEQHKLQNNYYNVTYTLQTIYYKTKQQQQQQQQKHQRKTK
ncbi:hypothetical protein DOY81_006120 [Sarcophaga bullata]|nr:hypothetical protein DOY81_006120 [Sarcophaga bullata]